MLLDFFKKNPIFGKSRLAQLKKIQTINNQNFDEVNDVQMNVWTWFSERDSESINREQAYNSIAGQNLNDGHPVVPHHIRIGLPQS